MTGLPRPKSMRECIKEYMHKDDSSMAERFLHTTGKCDVQDQDGKTLLMVAAMKGNTSLVERLISTGAAVNVRDNDKRSALFYATRCGYSDTVEYLLSHGARASVNKTDKNSDTPLHIACHLKYCSCARVLLKHGANARAYNVDGETPTSIVKNKGNKCMKQIFCPSQQTDEDNVYTNVQLYRRKDKRQNYEIVEDIDNDQIEKEMTKVSISTDGIEPPSATSVPHGGNTSILIPEDEMFDEHVYLDFMQNRTSYTEAECAKDKARESYINWDPYELDQQHSAATTKDQEHYNDNGQVVINRRTTWSDLTWSNSAQYIDPITSGQILAHREEPLKTTKEQNRCDNDAEQVSMTFDRSIEERKRVIYNGVLGEMAQQKAKKVPPPVKPKPKKLPPPVKPKPTTKRRSMYENVEV